MTNTITISISIISGFIFAIIYLLTRNFIYSSILKHSNHLYKEENILFCYKPNYNIGTICFFIVGFFISDFSLPILINNMVISNFIIHILLAITSLCAAITIAGVEIILTQKRILTLYPWIFFTLKDEILLENIKKTVVNQWGTILIMKNGKRIFMKNDRQKYSELFKLINEHINI